MTAGPSAAHIQASPALIGIDWGTSNLRAFLLDDAGMVLRLRQTELGILNVPDGDFAAAFAEQFGHWLEAYPDIPVLLSGMIGSRQGWSEAPYLACPTDLDSLAAALHPLPDDLGRPAFIVPGLSYHGESRVYDVIRGEETQLLGLEPKSERRLICLPGTHAKWAVLEGERVVQFHTGMSGEMFALLSRHSILGRLMPEPADGAATDDAAFARGLARADEPGGLLHHLFGVRAQALFDVEAPGGLRDFLSGLLLGHEVAGLKALVGEVGSVVVVGASVLTRAYAEALRPVADTVERLDGETAAAKGLWRIARRAGLIGEAKT